MAQQALFDGGVVPKAVERRRTSQRPGATPAPHARTVGDPIEVAASQVVGELDPLARARAAIALRDLAAEVFAVSFWHLATQRVVSLGAGKRRTMGLFKKDDVSVTRVGDPGPRDGYEAAILTALEKEKGAYGVVRRWFGSDVSNPWKVALGLARRELPGHGLAHMGDAGRGLISGMIRGTEELQYDAEAIRGTSTEFHRVHEAWRGFRDLDPLGPLLVESCRKALKSREESSE